MLGNVPFAELITLSRASPAWCFNAAGVLMQVAANQPRFDYDPVTLQPRGMLVEEARTNLLPYSSQLDNAAWTKALVSVTPNAGAAPDGTTEADSVVTTGTSDSYLASAAMPSSSAMVFSCFVKQGGASPAGSVCMRPITYATVTNDDPLFFNFATKAFSGATANFTSFGYFDVGGGWYRIWAAKAVQSGQVSSQFRVRAGTSLAVLNETVLAWGAQLEAGAFPTSYIVTTSAAATRAADSAILNNITPWFNPNEGTLYVEAILGDDSPASFPSLLELSDGTANNRLLLRRSNAGNSLAAIATASGTSYAVNDAGPFPSGQSIHAAFAYDAGAIVVCANGRAVISAASAPISGITKLSIGSRATGFQIGGPVRAARYYPRRLSNAELQALTA
ncbi:hypothetical protein D9M68_223050 [compost metagenome]